MKKKNSEKKEKKPEAKKKDKETGLEKEIKESEKKDDLKRKDDNMAEIPGANLQELILPSTGKAPVLEKVASSQPMPVFVRTGQRANKLADEKEDNSFKYALEAATKNEPKYSNFEGNYFSNLIATEQKSRQMSDLEKREIGFGAVADSRISDERKMERYDVPRNIESTRREIKTEFIQGRKEIKYTPSH